MTRTRAFLSWLATPFRIIARALMVLVNLSPRQMQALCTLAMIGGIIALSFQNAFYVMLVKRAAALLPAEHPFFTITTDQILYNSVMAGMFALFMSLIAFGAEWLRVKYKDFEAGTSRSAREAAQNVADAAQDEADSMGINDAAG